MTMPDDTRLPAIPQTPRSLEDLGGSALPPSLQILLDEGLYTRMKQLAGLMSKAEGFTPRHLIGKPEACFAIINTSLDWKLNPHHVARHTYQTPGGSIGFDGALVQSVLERSGRFVGAPEFEHHGDWEKLTGKFERKTSGKGNEYVVGTWTDHDALGLGIIVRWLVRGESKPRVWPGEKTPFWLTQCYPRNSPLWATDPKTQISYLAIRRFANLAAPGILGAASFDYDDLVMAGDLARDVTPPRPRPEDYATEATPAASAEQAEAETGKVFEVFDFSGEAHEYPTAEAAIEALEWLIAAARTLRALDGLTESNPTWAKYPSIIEAFKEQKETFKDPGNGQDRPVAGAQQPDPARDATPTQHGGPSATEHPEERQSSTLASKEDPLSSPPPSDAAPRGESKRTPETETLQKLAEAKTPQHLMYWTRKAIAECRDPADIDELWRNNEAHYKVLGQGDRKEIKDLFEQRNRELSA
jgi:hypothetical protein